MSQVAIDFIGNPEDANRAFAKMQAQVSKLEDRLRAVGSSGKKSGKDIADGVTHAVAQMVTFQTVIQTATQSWAVMQKNFAETAAAARKAAEDMRPFAGSQMGDANSRTRVIQARDMLIKHGITREGRGEAMDFVQTLQDAMGGDFKKAAKEADEMFVLRKLGIKSETLKDVGVMAAARGLDPGETARKFFEAGEVTGAGPTTLARLMPETSEFADLDQGIAMAAVLAAGMGDRKAKSGLMGVSQAFGPNASKEVLKNLKKFGVAPGTDPMEALAILQSRGVDETAEFQGLGIDATTGMAMQLLSQSRDKVSGLAGSLGELSTEERTMARLRQIEAENPEMRIDSENRRLESAMEFKQDFGPLAVEGLLRQQVKKKRGFLLRSTGNEQLGPIDLIDERGESTAVEMGLGAANPFNRADPGTVSRANQEMERILSGGGGEPATLQQLLKTGQETNELLRDIKRQSGGSEVALRAAAREFRGGPTMVPADVDR